MPRLSRDEIEEALEEVSGETLDVIWEHLSDDELDAIEYWDQRGSAWLYEEDEEDWV